MSLLTTGRPLLLNVGFALGSPGGYKHAGVLIPPQEILIGLVGDAAWVQGF